MCSPCAERQEEEGGALCSVLEVTEGRKQGLLWAEQRAAKEGHNSCSPSLPGSRQELPAGFNPFSALHPSCLANEQPAAGWGLSERRIRRKRCSIRQGRFSAPEQELPHIGEAAHMPEHR